jgi:hypothetical protein
MALLKAISKSTEAKVFEIFSKYASFALSLWTGNLFSSIRRVSMGVGRGRIFLTILVFG